MPAGKNKIYGEQQVSISKLFCDVYIVSKSISLFSDVLHMRDKCVYIYIYTEFIFVSVFNHNITYIVDCLKVLVLIRKNVSCIKMQLPLCKLRMP